MEYEENVSNACWIYFELDGGSGDFPTVASYIDQMFTIPEEAPTKESYEFGGWSGSDGAHYNCGDTFALQGNLTLTAVWYFIPTGVITFNLNGGAGDFPSITFKFGEWPTIPETSPTKEGCEFCGWYNQNGTCFMPGSTYEVAEEVNTLVAEWYVIPTGVITFDLNGGTGDFPPITFRFGEWPTIPEAVPTKERRQFYGWYNKYGDCFNPGSVYEVPEEQDTLTASWSDLMYTMTFDADGGTYYYDKIEDFEQMLVFFSTPTKAGHNFLYWEDSKGNTYVEGDTYSIGTEDETFTAHWERYGYVMTYEGIDFPDVVNMGESYVITSSIPEKEGHDFVCWMIGDDTYSAGDLITPTADMTFEAVWTLQHYTISFDLNGGNGSFNSLDKTYGVDITLPEAVPTKEKFVFDGWQDADGEKYSHGAVYTKEGHMTLTATWKEIFTLTYLNEDGSAFATQSKIEGEAITLYEEIPEKSGEMFKGWSIPEMPDIYTPGQEYTQDGDVTFTVVWKEKYTLTYLNEDGSVFATQLKYEGETVTLYQETPEKSGYEFTGWSVSDTVNTYSPGQEYTRDSDAVLSAQFTKTCLLVFWNSSSSFDYVQDVSANGICIPETIPEKNGYEFLCWKSNGYNEYYLPGEKYLGNEDMGFNVVWVNNNYVKVVYDVANSLDAISESTVSIGESIVISETVPTRNGYIFKGWTDADRSTLDIGEAQSITMYQPGETYNWDCSKRLLAVWERDQNSAVDNYDIGKFGEFSINVRTGTYNITTNDLQESGARMPIEIRHVYNSNFAKQLYTCHELVGLNCADFSNMNVGLGFKLNLMQSMRKNSIIHPDGRVSSYVYTDENGYESYFVLDEEKTDYDDLGDMRYVYMEKDGADMYYDPQARIMEIGAEKYIFDEYGRLVKISDEWNNQLCISYHNGQISTVVDGAGRQFVFEYTDTNLTKITSPDGTHIDYTYDEEGYLKAITYADGTALQIEYANSKKIDEIKVLDSEGVLITSRAYVVSSGTYSFHERGAKNGSIESGDSFIYEFSNGAYTQVIQLPKEYYSGSLTSEATVITYSFNEDGSIKNRNVVVEPGDNSTSMYFPDGVISNDNDHTVKAKNFSDNLLLNHRGQNMTNWTVSPESDTFSVCAVSDTTTNKSKYGQEHFELESSNVENPECGMYQTVTLPAGEYTYSAYVRIVTPFTTIFDEAPGAYLTVKDSSGNLIVKSEVLNCNDEIHNRISTSFTLAEETEVNVWLAVLGEGKIYADALQLEQNPFATAYNMLEDGGFDRALSSWNRTNGITRYTSTGFRINGELNISGSSSAEKFAWQTVPVKMAKSTRETFTLSGWAKGTGNTDENSIYRLRAVINYANDGIEPATEEYCADFIPEFSGWQYASVQFSKEMYREVNSVSVYCEYSYQSGIAYFDAIELTRDYIETGLSESDFYGEEDTEEEEVTPDVEIEEARDAFGNVITETAHTNNFTEGVIYRSFDYGESGNNLLSETDPRGNVTAYEVDPLTSRNTKVTDRCGNKTSYSYDSVGRVTGITSSDSDDTSLASVAYSYDSLDNITEIVRGDGLKYVLAYDPYHNLESIGVDGRSTKLITYTRRESNGRIKKIAYANGDYMEPSYSCTGYMISEKWYDSNDSLKYEYTYAYDNEGNIVKTIDKENEREYNYLYSEGNLVRSTEYDISGETRERLVTIFYVYNNSGELVRKRILPADGNEEVYHYTNADNVKEVSLTSLDASYIAKTTTDNLGRKISDTLDSLTKSYSYYSGEVTQKHKDNDLNLGYATTQLVKKITYSDGRTLQYVYDNEERITKVIDSIEGTTEYTYDALGQLVSEVKNNVTVNTMTYDNYGNITSKNGKSYIYGNEVWRDLLTSYDGKSITYDSQGNPVSYMGNSLEWEKGRQLKWFGEVRFKYNANGIRTYKIANTKSHRYILDGTKILKETFGTNTIIPIYDNEESVCGIVYNGTTYYFVKNLQGDVISITNAGGTTLARYSYDAWGKCTIAEDTTEAEIATINPYRYRTYYYDTETGLYYLQSRYYDPETGRFINGDHPEAFAFATACIISNAYAYCLNSPVISKDNYGNLAEQLIARIVLGAMIGFLVQLLSDLIANWFAKLFNKKSISINPSDYVSSMLSWALTCVSFSKKSVEITMSLLPVVVKQVGRVFNKTFDWIDLLMDIITVLVSFAIGKCLTKKEIGMLKKIKMKAGSGNGAYNRIRIKTNKLNLKVKVWGVKLNLVMNISSFFASNIYSLVSNAIK